MATRPNIILVMTDDQGWGDTGYNGHPELRTPHLDQLASEGVRFDRFYAAAPVCSPTRGSSITGRHPYRYGIFFANVGHLPPEEVPLGEALKTQGYATGHFGKWHIGTLTKDILDGRRGGREDQAQHYAPPWDNGFDECFSTEVQMPTWDPMRDQPFPSKYWTGPGQWATDNLDGDDSRVIMDRALPFIRRQAQADTPFLAVIWFHAPHSEVRGGPEYRKQYDHLSEDKQHYYACLTAMDEQVGRLRRELEELGIADNSVLWFCSDNGPAGEGGGTAQHPGKRQQGSPGPFRGRKGSLYEGGVRVPGILYYPDGIKGGRVVDAPCCTSDYFPTILDLLGFRLQGSPEPLDGISLLPILRGETDERAHPIGFESQKQVSWVDDRYKLYSPDAAEHCELYDLLADKEETTDIADRHPETVRRMAADLDAWRESCRRSRNGEDYPAPPSSHAEHDG